MIFYFLLARVLPFFAVVFCVAASATFLFLSFGPVSVCGLVVWARFGWARLLCRARVFRRLTDFSDGFTLSACWVWLWGEGVVLPLLGLGLMAGDDDALPSPGSGGTEEVSGPDGVIIPGQGPNVTSDMIQTDSNVIPKFI